MNTSYSTQDVLQNPPAGNEQPQQLSVSDKIFQVQRDNSIVKNEKNGPELELFFHELKPDKSIGRTIINYFVATCGFLLMIVLYPVIAVSIKLSTSGPVIRKIETEGRSGKIFERYEFATQHNRSDAFIKSPQEKEYFTAGKILAQSGLHKLPAVINIFKGEMNAVGPVALDRSESTYWNNIFDDYYKRHAVAPGLITIYKPENTAGAFPDIENQLKKEFRYIGKPTLTKDIKILFGLY